MIESEKNRVGKEPMTNTTEAKMFTDIDPATISAMIKRVHGHLIELHGVCNGLEAYTDARINGEDEAGDVFLLEREKDFKFGSGKELIAVIDGGKNKFGKPIKCVRYFNYYLGNNKCKPNDRTYTYSHEKASEMWKAKIGEGFKRVK